MLHENGPDPGKDIEKRRNPGKSPEKGRNSSNPQKKADIERESKTGPNS